LCTTVTADGDEEAVLQPLVPELAEDDRGIAWHYCGIGVKD
jgi:hypothetical protein